jgi:hypothetical protein
MDGEARLNDFRVICDASGFKCWASETVIQWDGKRVLRQFADQRHPQDFRRALAEDTSVPDPRPEGADVFLAVGDVTQDDL